LWGRGRERFTIPQILRRQIYLFITVETVAAGLEAHDRQGRSDARLPGSIREPVQTQRSQAQTLRVYRCKRWVFHANVSEVARIQGARRLLFAEPPVYSRGRP